MTQSAVAATEVATVRQYLRRCQVVAVGDDVATRAAGRGKVRQRVLGDRTIPIVLLSALMLGTAAFLLYLQSGMTFLVDEWIVLDERRAWNADALLDPLYEHFSLVPMLIFKVLMSTVGMDPHVAYVFPLIALHVTCVALVYVLARRRLGPWFGLAPATLILFLWSAYDSVLLPIQISFLASVAAGLGVLALFDAPASKRRDAFGAVLLLVSLASSGVGLIFAVATCVEVMARPGRRTRIWIVIAPLLVFGLWYSVYGARGLQQGSSVQSNIPAVPRHVAESAAALAGALSGVGHQWGRVLAAIAIVGLVAAYLRGTSFSTRALAVSTALLSFWVLGGLARAHQENAPEASRYFYPGAVLAVLLGTEALSHAKLDRRWGVFLGSAVVVAAVGNASVLRGAVDAHQQFSREIRAQFAALQVLGRRNVDPGFVPGTYLAPTVGADAYFAMIDDLGSPASVERDILSRSEVERRVADATLAAALADAPQRPWAVGTPATTPQLERVMFGTARKIGPCLRVDVRDPGSRVLFRLLGGALEIDAGALPVDISVRRFGKSYQRLRSVRARTEYAFPVPRGGLAEPWHFQARSRDPFSVCVVDPARS